MIMFLIPLLDLYDRLFERFGVTIHPWDALPNDQIIVFGTIVGSMENQRFLRIKLPIHTYGPDWIHNYYRMRVHYALWIENRRPITPEKTFLGWNVYPSLGD